MKYRSDLLSVSGAAVSAEMQSFVIDCSLTGPLQLLVERPGMEGGELRLMHQPFAIIGRDSRADLVLDHARVSRRHVYFQVIEGRPFWVDLESRTGTRFDGVARKHGWLTQSGRALSVGPYVIRRITDATRAGSDRSGTESLPVAPFVAAAYGNGPLPEVALEFLNGPSRATTWPVRRVMSFIGSAIGCKFRLTDASVSRFHASFLRTSGGLWIVDLLGQGGTTVNEVPVRFSHLTDGDRLAIGRYQIRVRCRLGRKGSAIRLPDRSRATDVVELCPDGHILSRTKSTEDLSAATIPFMPGSELANRAQYPLPIPALSAEARSKVMASEGIFPSLNPIPPEFAESMLVPLVNQFGVMQQQMFDQFQHAMAMMLQMFGTMHREQMAVIRGELDQLHELTKEFHSLRNELAIRTQKEGEMPTSLARTAVQGIEQMIGTKPTTPEAAEAPQEVSKTKPVQENMTLASQSCSWESVTPEHQSSSLASAEESLASEGSQELAAASSRERVGRATTTPADTERDSIVWLHQRIMSLQRERETRWQKILKLLPGSF